MTTRSDDYRMTTRAEVGNRYEVRKYALDIACDLQRNIGGNNRVTMLVDAEAIYQWLIT